MPSISFQEKQNLQVSRIKTVTFFVEQETNNRKNLTTARVSGGTLNVLTSKFEND